MNSIKPEYDVVIVGAGHSGLCLSYLLNKSKIDHIILEKNEIGST
jgi:putative flavoprotein involved in K+ transport